MYSVGKIGYYFCCKLLSDANAALSIDGFSDWSNTSVRLAEHEKSSCHLQASVQWFEIEQRLTKCCSLDSIHDFCHLPFHQTFIVFCLFASLYW